MLVSRLIAFFIVVGASLWIGSGVFGRTEDPAHDPAAAADAPAAAPFQVAVMEAQREMHARSIVLSGRTEADDRASAIARTPGTLVELKVSRGDAVKEGDVIAVLSDEARLAQVEQARARLTQRRAELDARLQLIRKGVAPAIEKTQIEAELRGAEAALAQAEAEADRGQVLAPITGTVSQVPVSTGQAMQLGSVVAEIVALDPMLAVVEVSEQRLGGVKVGDPAAVRLVTGQTAEGKVRFISPTASEQTRTYRVDIEIDNPAADIADGVTAEVGLKLAPAEAVRVPRSALTFSADGTLSVRVVEAGERVASVPVQMVEDSSDQVWVAGPADGARIIVQGQDFVKDGTVVAAVPAPSALLSRN
jgi:multidrug efflux system membrane fusion protein